jgi:hypothetical protein
LPPFHPVHAATIQSPGAQSGSPQTGRRFVVSPVRGVLALSARRLVLKDAPYGAHYEPFFRPFPQNPDIADPSLMVIGLDKAFSFPG